MNVMIVDDWQSRHDLIKRVLSNAGRFDVTYANRYSPDQVTEGDIATAQVIFLDHDMCRAEEGKLCPNLAKAAGENLLDSGCGCSTGKDVVKKIISSGKKPVCIVHTANPAGGRIMTNMLLDAGIKATRSSVTSWFGSLAYDLVRAWGIEDVR